MAGDAATNPVCSQPDAARVNAEYYARPNPGRADYWRLMAAPRHRVATILGLLATRPPRSVVDLGCGGGELLAEIHARHPAAALCGVDLSSAQIAANRDRDPGVEWLSLDLDDPDAPVPDALQGRFDVVVASELVEHVRRPDLLLSKAASLASPQGGRVIVTTQSGPVHETERRVGHVAHFSAGEMAALLAASGLRPLRVWNTGHPFHDWSKRLANRDPDATMRRFSDAPYGWPQKAVCRALRVLFRVNSGRRGAQLFALAERS